MTLNYNVNYQSHILNKDSLISSRSLIAYGPKDNCPLAYFLFLAGTKEQIHIVELVHKLADRFVRLENVCSFFLGANYSI